MPETVVGVIVVAVPLLAMVGLGLYDLIWRQRAMATGARLGWGSLIVLVPLIGILVYVLLRPPPAASGKASRHASTTDIMHRLNRLRADHDAGVANDEEFGTGKAELFGL